MKQAFPAVHLKHLLSIFAIGAGVIFCERVVAQAQNSVPIAHAHNDYEHKHPLHDAMKAGFTSIEADVYLIENQLLVAHNQRDTKPERSLESLYLEPLRRHFSTQSNDSTRQTFWLMIDVKSDSVSTYRKLHSVLKKYQDMIAEVSDLPPKQTEWKNLPVRVVISGNRAKQEIIDEQPRLAGIDGRLADLESGLSQRAMPWISDNWRSHFTWRGENEFPAEEQERLRKYVRQAHQKGRLLRFWATPDSPNFWDALLDAGVDLINADDLPGLNKYLRQRTQQPGNR